MKIAFFLSDLSSAGGIERVTSILSNTLVERGYDITVISMFRTNNHPVYNFSNQIKIKYITDEAYLTKEVGGISRLLMYFKILPRIKKILKEEFFDFIIGQGFPVNFTLWLAGCKKKLICCEHVHYNYYGSFIQKCRIKIYKQCLHTVVLTEDDRNQYQRYFNSVSLIPNPASFQVGQVTDLSSKRIISVGRLEYQKGYDLLLHASKKVFQEHPDWILDIYGSGVLKEQLIRLRDDLDLAKNVFFKGVTNDIKQEYLSSSLYVLPSRYEGFGMVLVEAAACGLPIIAFDCPTGPKDILCDGGGILIESNNIDKLTEAIIGMLEDKNKRLHYAQKGPYIAERYTPSVICNKWDVLFNGQF